jgi:hypothetical protein
LVRCASPPDSVPLGGVGDLHRADVRDALPVDARGAGRVVEAGAVAGGARREDGGALDEGPDVRLERVDVLAEHRLADLRDEALGRDVDLLDLDLAGLAVQQVLALLGRQVADRHVRRHERLERGDHPAVGRVAGHEDRAVDERLALVDDRGEVEVGHAPAALARRAHAAEVDDVAGDALLTGVGGHDAARLAGRDVEGERRRRPDVRVTDAAEEDAEHRVGVGGRADRGAHVRAHPLLVDDDRRRDALEPVDLGPGQRRHEALDEGAVRLVDHPLRLGGDGAEDERALARARHPGEDGEPPLRQDDVDVLEVVLAGALDADDAVGVGDVRAVGVRPLAAQRRSWMRSRLPAGSRNAQSRTPYGWSVGSCTTSASLDWMRSNVPSTSSVASSSVP